MQIWNNLLRVIFMLATIVNLADCCSSRILLLKKHSYKIVHQYKFHNYDPAQQQIQEKIAQNLNLNSSLFHNLNNNNMSMSTLNITMPTIVVTTDLPSIEEAFEINSTTDTEDITTYSSEKLEPLPTLPELNIFNITQIQLDRLPPGDGPPAPVEDAGGTTTTTISTVNILEPPISLTPPPFLEDINEHDEIDDFESKLVEDVDPTEMHVEHQLHREQTTEKKYDLYSIIMREMLFLECNGIFLTDYCLNGGRCFLYPVGNNSFFSCECADGYVGERCEFKSVNEYYMHPTSIDATPPTIRKARIVFTFPMLIIISVFYIIIGAIIIIQRVKNRLPIGMASFDKRKPNIYLDLV